MSNNVIAIVGYTLILTFSLYKLADTASRPIDLLANVLLLGGLSALIVYHARLIKTHRTEEVDATQKTLRLVAHSTLVTFLLLTLSPYSLANFQYYDMFALAGHSSLLASVALNMSQLFGIGMLALYFMIASAQSYKNSRFELINFVGRALLLVFFVSAFTQGIRLP
jgi:uncharacterized membrane protein